ncbi:MAG: hypothetical protein AAF632_27775 [Bacteroidota bacterium]
MTKSKFDNFVVVAIYGIAILGPILVIYFYSTSYDEIDKFLIYFGFPLLGLAVLLIWVIELPKIKIIEITQTEINFIHPITKHENKIQLVSLDGYKKQYQPTRFGLSPALLIYRDGKILQEISSIHVKNLEELEKHLKTKVQYLGLEEFKFFDYLIQRIRRKIGT